MASPSTPIPPLPAVPPTAQSELAQILRYRQDRRLHIQEQGWIVRRDERTRLREVLRMPPLRPSQLKLRAAQEWFKSQGLMARIIVVKSRKTGISTYVQLDQVLDGMEFGYETLTVSNRAPEADYLFSIGREFYDHYELEKPTLLSDTRRCLVFDNKAEFAVIPGGTEHGGSGRTPQRLHWCLDEDTLVLMADGTMRSIKEVGLCDLVLTGTDNRSRASVMGITKRRLPCRTLKFYSINKPLVCTPDHKLWTKSGWRKAGDLKPGDAVGHPVPKIRSHTRSSRFWQPESKHKNGCPVTRHPEEIPHTYELGRVVGLYLAEGSIDRHPRTKVSYSVCFAVHDDEVQRTLEWLKPLESFYTSVGVDDRQDCLTTVIKVRGKIFASWMNRHCGMVDGKRFPEFVYESGNDFARGCLHGYFAGDAHFSSKRNNRLVRVSSVRLATVTGSRDLLAALGYGWATLRFKKGGRRCGRNEQDQWILNICGPGSVKLATELGKPYLPYERRPPKPKVTIEGGYAWVPLESSSSPLEIQARNTYDLELAHGDHSYQTLHCRASNSECPKTPKKESLWASLINAVEESPDSQVIIEGTAVGRDAVFFELHDETSRTSTVSWTYEGNEPKIHVEIPDQDAWNGWLAIFISPADNPEDRKPFSSSVHREVFESTLSGYEKRFIESSGLEWNEALECVNWVRYILKAKCRGSERLRKQEFPLFAEEAFGSIKFNRFDQDALLEVFHEAPSKRGYLDRRSVWDPSPSLVADNAHDLVIFKPPVKGHIYALGIDPIKGHSYEEMIKNPDQTYEEAAAVVVDCSDFFRQVAVFGGPEYEEETLFTYCKALADWYGAYVQIERGGGYGTHLKEKFEQSDYPKRLLYISGVDHMTGYYMTTASEPALIKSAADMLNRREFILHDRKTYAQYMEAVKTVHGGAAHLPGKTNDYLKAHCHALWCGVWAMSKERPGDGGRSGPRRKSAWQKACDKSRGQFDFFH